MQRTQTVNLEREYLTAALEALKPHLFSLPVDVQRKVKLATYAFEQGGSAPMALLNKEIGADHWALCRDTAANRERYGKCITRKQYAAAERRAMEIGAGVAL